MRKTLPTWVIFASLLTSLGGQACDPTRDPSLELSGPGPDGAGTHQPLCDPGSLRCSRDKGSIERCTGKSWTWQASCDVGAGEVCRGSHCASPCEDLPSGSVGCSFYAANLWSTSSVGQFGIVASNTSSTISAQVSLADPTGVIQTQTAPPGGLVVFRLDHYRNKLSQTEQAAKGFHLSSSAPVAAYLFHPIDAAQVWTGSAMVLLPEHVLAKDYFAVSYTYNAGLTTIPPQGQGFVAVLALSDNTDVQITVPVQTMAGGSVPAAPAGGTLHRTLNRLEVLEVAQQNSLEDISGAIVKASDNVVVFGGAGGVTIPRTALGGDHLGVQMFPLQTWGKHYVGTKFKQRNATDHDYYRIVASIDDTHVSFTGTPPLPAPQTLMRGAFYEFDTDADFEIVADQPIAAFQYLPAWGNLSGNFNPADFPDGAPPGCAFGPTSVQCFGDANMAPLVPVEQYLSDYIFYVPQTYAYDYVNVTAPLATALMLDDNPVGDSLRPLGDGTLGRVILRLQAGNHRITGNMPFGLMSYGYAYATSYSYPGGLKLETINPLPPG